jgi:hypothetical protein
MIPAIPHSAPSAFRRLVRTTLLGLTLLAHDRLDAQGAAVASPARLRARVSRGAACDTSWSTPRELLTRDGLRIYVEGPNVLATAHGLVLTGSPTVGWMRRTNFIDTMVPVRPIDPGNTAGVLLDSSGAAVPLPRLEFSNRPFTILPVSEGSDLRLVWATTSDTAASYSNLDSLWTSTLHDGKWTPPQSIVQGQRIRWFTNFATLTQIDGAPLAIVPMQDTTQRLQGGLLILRRSGNGWKRRWIGTSSHPSMGSSLIATRANSVVAAFTGDLEFGKDTSSNAVFVIRIGLGDSSATTRVLRRVGAMAAVDPKLFRLAGRLHLVWLERANDRPGGRSLYESTSADEGVTWSEPSLTTLPNEYRGLNVVARNGSSAFAGLYNDDRREVIVLARTEGKWLVDRAFEGSAFTPPTLTVRDDTLLLMFGSAVESPEVRTFAPFSMIATRPLRCAVR